MSKENIIRAIIWFGIGSLMADIIIHTYQFKVGILTVLLSLVVYDDWLK